MPKRIGQPGEPDELPHPDALWVHGGLIAAMQAALDAPDPRFGFDRLGLHWNSTGGSWWRLSRAQGGRPVLTGFDPLAETGADWTELCGYPPVDLLHGAPPWTAARWLADLLAGQRAPRPAAYYQIGFLYWWDGTWGRAEYPEHVADDGLCLAEGAGSPLALLGNVLDLIEVHSTDVADKAEDVARLLDGIHAEDIPAVAERGEPSERVLADALRAVTELQAAGRAGQMDAAGLRRVFDALGADPGDLDHALEVARHADLTPGGTPLAPLPAG